VLKSSSTASHTAIEQLDLVKSALRRPYAETL